MFVGRNLVEQFGQNITVGNVLMCRQRGTYLNSVRVERDMDLAPRAALRVAILTDLPFAFAVDLSRPRCRRPNAAVLRYG